MASHDFVTPSKLSVSRVDPQVGSRLVEIFGNSDEWNQVGSEILDVL